MGVCRARADFCECGDEPMGSHNRSVLLVLGDIQSNKTRWMNYT